MVVFRWNLNLLISNSFELIWNKVVCVFVNEGIKNYLGIFLVLSVVKVEAHGSRVY